MAAAAEVLIFGNPDLPEGTPERPLVTFALFAYNQEQYVREAVEGAFAQTYSPLEIILSDDCSSDRTFEIMKEMAAGYRGPHRVVVRRNTRNLGTLGHVLSAAKLAIGGVFVLAAGDDVSLPQRTTVLSNEFTKNDVACAFSAAMTSDITRRFISGSRGKWVNLFSAELIPAILGATSAYRREFLLQIPIPTERILHEDIFLFSLMSVLGRTHKIIAEPLVRYRTTCRTFDKKRTISEKFAAFKLQHKNRKKRIRHFLLLNAFCRRIVDELFAGDVCARELACERLENTRKRYLSLANFFDARVAGKALAFVNVHAEDRREAIRFVLGESVYFFMRSVLRL